MVSKSNYQIALNMLERINPALDALQKIDRQALDRERVEAGKIDDCQALLLEVRNKFQSTIDLAQKQFKGRPQKLIDQAMMLANNTVPAEIEREQQQLKRRISARQAKVEELRLRQFTDSEIDQIIPPISSDELSISHARVEELRRELDALLKFASDAPRFDVELLKGTRLAEQPA